ncbi:hypothetical protein XENORESO_001374 [Xenotaenia resolanae]|uniref:Secreted protein n=1 Tax=Xenotaenia resolanae TaxID=208358 RepID=A0ABV0VWJ4_9TELE
MVSAQLHLRAGGACIFISFSVSLPVGALVVLCVQVCPSSLTVNRELLGGAWAPLFCRPLLGCGVPLGLRSLDLDLLQCSRVQLQQWQSGYPRAHCSSLAEWG